MSARVDKYVDLLSRYGLYGENGYYVDPHIIHIMVVDELKLNLSFSDIEEYVNTCEISITESEIKDFEPYSLQYFKTYTSILKKKLKTLFEILEDLFKIKEGTISKEGLNRIVDLDFHINESGDVYTTDIERLADAIIYNVKNLHDKITKGNNPKTYLTFKESKHNMARDGIFESEIYPKKEVQIKDLYYEHCKEFIALSENQKEKLKKERHAFFYKILRSFNDNDQQDNYTLVKTRENNDKLKS